MSPHAIASFESEYTSSNYECPKGMPRFANEEKVLLTNGSKAVKGVKPARKVEKSVYLQRSAEHEIHDMICVGFGPASLAIAVALHDRHEALSASGTTLTRSKVLFLEKQAQFAWHSGMLLPSAKMQISFLKDLASLRNPRSHFTFVNYLHQHSRLVAFTNLDTFLPSRIEFEDYLRWCAAHFDGDGLDDGVVEYGQEVVAINPEPTVDGRIPSFTVVSRDGRTGAITTKTAKHVIVAAGGAPKIPQVFPKYHPRIIHSSRFAHSISTALPDRDKAYRIAVIGGGQSAAEIYSQLHSAYPNSETRLLIREPALKPSDDSPFVNEVFNPERVDLFYRKNESIRKSAIRQDKTTNYGVVRLELLEKIYETLYMQRLTYGNAETSWPHRILPQSQVVDVRESLSGGIVLEVQRPSTMGLETSQIEEFACDAVILGTGYERNAHEELLLPLQHLAPQHRTTPKIVSNGTDGTNGMSPIPIWRTRRDYSVIFDNGILQDDCGIWLQGCCEVSHGLADSLLSILAVRGGEIVDSIFGSTNRMSESQFNGVKSLH